jgi:NAD(P)-dependent dehydrogenase (short-subunit alcohol dehydrogenase family)
MARGALEGKVVVIVGASTGLGLSGLRACIAAGARVVAVCPIPEAPLGDERGVRIHVGDARNAETARGAVRQALADFGGFDALYHVAGGSGRAFGDGPLHALTDAGWEETLRLNLTSAFYSARAATESFLERKAGGSVLLMGSVLGASPSPGFFDTHGYAAAKAAILGLVTAAAASYAPAGIRFNAVMPGLTETPMSRRAMSDPQIVAFVRCKQPLEGGRAGTPADLDGAVVFFLSDDSRFVTGQALAVDGGWSVSDGSPRGLGTAE